MELKEVKENLWRWRGRGKGEKKGEKEAKTKVERIEENIRQLDTIMERVKTEEIECRRRQV